MNDNTTRLINNKMYYEGIIILVIICNIKILACEIIEEGTQVNLHFRWLLSDLIINPPLARVRLEPIRSSPKRDHYI